jgi:FkbM family methyltransferase
MTRSVNIQYLGTNTELFVHDNEAVSNYIFGTKSFYEIQFLDFISKYYNKQKIILDIGANIGNHSLFFLKFLECDAVYSFEPMPCNIDLLKKNTQAYSEKSVIYEVALSNTEGEMPVYNSDASNLGGFSLHSYENGSSFLVGQQADVIKLDSLNLTNVSMMKLDVENHENEVLDGARQTILNNKPIIFIENLFHGYPNVCPNPNPHEKIFTELNYKKVASNIFGGYMDMWVSA